MRLAISLPLSVVAGLATGFAIFQRPQSLPSHAPAAAHAGEKTAELAAAPDSGASIDAKAQRLVAAALRQGNQNEQENEIYLAIEALTADDFRQLVGNEAAFKAMVKKMTGVDWQTGRDLVSGLIRRWLEIDCDAVVAWASRALDFVPRDEAASHWLRDALASRIPEEMLALVSSRKDSQERIDLIKTALSKLAEKDSTKARAWLAGCTDPKDKPEAEKALRVGIVRADPLQAIELAASIKDRTDATNLLRDAARSAAEMGPGILRQLASMPMKPWMVASVISELAEQDPDMAMELAMKSRGQGPDSSSALRTAFAALADRDPKECMAKLEGLEGADLSAAVSAIGFTWAARDPAAGLSWLMQRPIAERTNQYALSRGAGSMDTLVVGFYDWLENTPSEARAWADALPQGATRDKLQTEIARALVVRGESAEATRILSGLGKAADPNAVAKVASAWARSDPQAAADWAIAQEPGTAQSRALAGIVGTWANDDQAGVEKWLAQFPPGEARDRSVKAFLWRNNAWTTTREQRIAEFDTWFDLVDDPWQRAQLARSSFWQRKSQDPAAARTWLSSLQNVDPEIVRTVLRDNAN